MSEIDKPFLTSNATICMPDAKITVVTGETGDRHRITTVFPYDMVEAAKEIGSLQYALIESRREIERLQSELLDANGGRQADEMLLAEQRDMLAMIDTEGPLDSTLWIAMRNERDDAVKEAKRLEAVVERLHLAVGSAENDIRCTVGVGSGTPACRLKNSLRSLVGRVNVALKGKTETEESDE